ncbi:ankyrin repeat and KH domain-containing protein mask-like [Saccostrea cucullata]|uniref:ankyrin repeat and KH domain-containing protein mask-like n=1 Tax=Saccostrea cuccullata TaxID=36930 RepID=UPI002ED3C245
MPLIISCECGYIDIVKELIEAGADVNLKGKCSTPVSAACSRGHVDIVRQLLNAGAKINQSTSCDTPLMAGCRGGNATTVKVVLEAGASVNLKNHEGETPLYKAVDNDDSNVFVLKMLIERGADSTICTNSKVSPLYLALLKNMANVFKALKKSKNKLQQKKVNLHLLDILEDIQHANVAVDSKDDVIFTKKIVWDMTEDLHGKLLRADCDVLRHLLCFGFDANQNILIRKKPNQSDIKPVLFRIIDGKLFYDIKQIEKIVCILLEAGADVNLSVKYTEYNSLVDKEGVTALERTRQKLREHKNPKNYFPLKEKRIMERKYQMILTEIKRHVRRYSI